jgi:hypothetical protein
MREFYALTLRSVVAVVSLAAATARADFITIVTIVDASNTWSAFHSALTSHAIAAGQLWGAHFAGTTSLELEILFDNSFPRATGRSEFAPFLTTRNGFFIAEQSVGTEIRTGVDPNGTARDLVFTMNTDYMQNELWFDSDPFSRTAPIPASKTDAMSVFLHEFGHAIAFNGWQNHTDGTYPDNFRSTYDELKTFDGTNFYFNGPNATALYGGPVPITFGNVNHIGNDAPRPGEDLIPDLMNGVVFEWQTRYEISPLDLAIIQDTGLNIESIPEPSSLALLTVTGILYASGRRVRSRSTAHAPRAKAETAAFRTW